jgi:hypothetical protein
MRSLSTLVVVVALSSASVVHAQTQSPAPPSPPPAAEKGDAKQLMQTGVRLVQAHDYLGALEVFKSAYERFASAKILLNIGTTLKLLDRPCEAANAYQRYLDAADADPARRGEVVEVLADLDKGCAQLELTVEPGDADLEVGNERVNAAQAKLLRIAPGPFTVRARREGFQPAEQTGTTAIGQHAPVAIKLAATAPTVVDRPVYVTREAPAQTETIGVRTPLAAVVEAHVSVVPRAGSAWLIGAAYDVNPHLAVEAELLLGPGLEYSATGYMGSFVSVGAYVGASYTFLNGAWRPRASAGLPMFESGSWRFSGRVAGGVEYIVNRHFSLIGELGAEYNFNPPSDIQHFALVPAFAASGRL